jgi:hypothetical protein
MTSKADYEACEICGDAPAVIDIPAFSEVHGCIRMFACRACAEDLDCYYPPPDDGSGT